MDSPYIGRIVVLVSPLIAAASLAVVNLVQDVVGVNLDGDELTALLTAAVVGAFGLIYKWLSNRGIYEQTMQIQAEVPPELSGETGEDPGAQESQR